jgi:hypothetical protein
MADNPQLGELEQLILLTILRLGPDVYGLSIARAPEAEAGRRLSRGALYTSLDRLETRGSFAGSSRPAGRIARRCRNASTRCFRAASPSCAHRSDYSAGCGAGSSTS